MTLRSAHKTKQKLGKMSIDIAETRAPRSDSRRSQLLNEAAWLFRQKGFGATSMRDIASAVGMQAGSLYCHFKNKEELLLAIYELGVKEITDTVTDAIAAESDPWARFEAACTAHLEALLRSSDFPQVVVRVLPVDVPKVATDLTILRDGYEQLIGAVIDALPLADDVDRTTVRHMFFGALNNTTIWFSGQGDSPGQIARKFVRIFRGGLE